MTTTSAESTFVRPRGCRCATPFRDEDSCLLCGRRLPQLVTPAPRRRRSPHDDNPWTPAGVVRALRTFEFFVGRPPSHADWSFEDDKSWPSVRTVLAMFGSFDSAITTARAADTRSSA